ncbi:MAG: amidohydrolase family protein [Burkholderiales bacterium]
MPDPTLRCDIAISRATVLPFEGPSQVIADCDIVISGRHIVAMGAGAAGTFAPDRIIDGRDLIIMPGLCNAHTHSTETLARGLADAAPFATWIEAVWTRLDALDPEALAIGVRLAAAEMLHGGVTSVVDHFRQTPACAHAIDAAAQAWIGTGMRTTLAIMLRDRGVPAWVNTSLSNAFDVDRQLALCNGAATRWGSGSGDLNIAIGPSSPTRCTDRMLTGIKTLAGASNLKIHMHADETREDAALARSVDGATAISRLHTLGLLGPHLSVAHAVWVTEDDIDRLADSGTFVVHNPVSNLRLGSGRAPIERMLARGVQVAIGTDGAASNDTQNVLEATKLAVMLPRIAVSDRAQWPTAATGLAMAIATPARAFAMGSGALKVGDAADFAAFDRHSLPLAPCNDLATQIVFAGAALRARHVAIGGKLVVDDHTITTFDEAALLESASGLHFQNHPDA